MQLLHSLKKPSVIPGFNLSLGFTVFYLSLIVLIPLSGLFFKTSILSISEFWNIITSDRVLAAYRLTFGTALAAAAINAVMGLLLAWVLIRYEFPGKKIIDAMVDLPFALPTAIAGIALTTIYASGGWLGKYLDAWGFKVAFTPLGIIVALVFVGMPFVIRTVEPILQDLDREVEEAAASLGASRLQTFCYIIFPNILPAFLTGFSLAFARGLGEYGSVIFIAGNMPMSSEVVPLLIVIELEQYNYAGATAIALTMLLASFVLLFLINLLQKWSGRYNNR